MMMKFAALEDPAKAVQSLSAPPIKATSVAESQAVNSKQTCTCGGGCPQCAEPSLQRKHDLNQPPLQSTSSATSIVHDVLRSSGESLPNKISNRQFSHVRLHTDAAARTSAASVGAAAYTVGEHVVLGDAALPLDSERGEAILRHELVHTMQQPRIGHTPPSRIPVGEVDTVQEREAEHHARSSSWLRTHSFDSPDTQPILRRLTITRTCETFTGPCRADSAEEADSREAFDRMGRTTVGRWLLDELNAIRLIRNSTIDAHFANNVVGEGGGVLGQFYPPVSGATAYTALVDLNAHQALGTARPAEATSPLPRETGPRYGGGGRDVPTYVVERPSLLAETLFHEMLHIWFINTIGTLSLLDPAGAEFGISGHDPTGHLNAAQGEIDRRYLDRLKQFAVQIYRLESDPERLRQAAARNAAAQTPPPVTRPGDVPDIESQGGGQSRPITFNAGVAVGAVRAPFAGRPSDFPVEAQAGVLFGRALQFGVRGEAVWFPRVGLVGVGGGVSLNFLQTEDVPGGGSRVANRPWVFDLSAGAAYLIGSPDPLLLRGSAGVGIEHGGPDEWRPFWRVGVALDLNPTSSMLNVGYGATFTIGVRH